MFILYLTYETYLHKANIIRYITNMQHATKIKCDECGKLRFKDEILRSVEEINLN